MPRLSESMEEGTIVAWLRGDRDTVSRGDELVEIETDKATMVHEADYSGVLTIVVREKETVPVGTVIAIIGSGPGPDDDDAREEASPASAEPSEEVASKEPVPASPRGAPRASVARGTSSGALAWSRDRAGLGERSRWQGDEG